MGKISLNSRINCINGDITLPINYDGLKDLHESWLNQALLTTSDVVHNKMHLTSDLVVDGNVLVNGPVTTIQSTITTIEDNIILINANEDGSGVTLRNAGFEIDRGTLPNYQVVYNEDTLTLRIGDINNTLAVACREDNPLDHGIAIWNDTIKRFDSKTEVNLDIFFSSTTNSMSSSTGSIHTSGGIGITKDLFINGKINLNDTAYIYNDTSSFTVSTASDINIINTQNITIPLLTKINWNTLTPVSINLVSDGTDLFFNNSSGRTIITNTNNSTSSSYGALVVDGALSVNKNLVLNCGDQDYILSSINNNLYIENQGSTESNSLILFTQTGDNSIKIYGIGSPILFDNTEDLFVGYNSSTIAYNIRTEANGLGTVRNISLYTAGNNNQLLLINNGTISCSSTLPSTSRLSASLILSGGLSINCSTDATSSTNGGALTIYGGLSVGKSVYLSGIVSFSNTTDTTIINTGSVQTLGGMSVAKNLLVHGNVILTEPTQNYQIKSKTLPDTSLVLQSQGTGNPCELIMTSFDQNLNNNILLSMYSIGGLSGTNNESIHMGYYSIDSKYRLKSTASGTGIVREIIIETGSNINQLEIMSDGTISCSSTIASSSNNIGALKLAGGISISNITDATSISCGGTFTTSGGLAIGKSLFIGGILNSNDITSSSTSTVGALIMSGGLSISNTTDSSSISCGGTFTTAGGLAIGKSVFIGGLINNTNTTESTSTTIGSIITSGGLSIAKSLFIGGIINNINTTESSSINTGSVILSGGIAISKSLSIGGNIGNISITKDIPGINIINGNMDSSNKYTNGIKFMSSSTSFTTENPKLLALIIGKVTENYISDSTGGMGLEFMTTSNNPGVTNIPSSRMVISNEGIISISNTFDSTSTITGSIQTAGGLSITKSLFVGSNINIIGNQTNTGTLIVNNTTDTTSINTGSIQTSGGLAITKSLYIGKSIILSDTYTIKTRSIQDNSLLIQSQGNEDFSLNLVTNNQDGSSNINLTIYGVGGDNVSNYECIDMGYDHINELYIIQTMNKGSGILRDLSIETNGNDDQLRLYANGTISCSSTISSTTVNSAAIILSGGLSISNTTDSSSISCGGTFTTAGGLAIGKSVFIGGLINNTNTTESTSTTIGSIISAGGIAIAKSLFMGGSLNVATDLSIGTLLTVDSIHSITNISTITNITNTLTSNGTNSGCLTLSGGIGIAKDVTIGGITNVSSYINMNNNLIKNVLSPSNPTDAVNRSYVDNLIAGLTAKAPVVAATTVVGNMATSFASGQIIDTVTLEVGNRILIKDQGTVDNGIYIVTSGTPTRSNDMSDTSSAGHSIIFVSGGHTNIDSGFQCTNIPPNDIVGTDILTFIQFTGLGQIIAGDGLDKFTNTLFVLVDNSSIEIFNDHLRISNTAISTGLSGGSGIALTTSSNQSHVTQLGTITTGTWHSDIVSVTYGGTGNSTFTVGNLLFGNDSNAIATSNNIFWDNTNQFLGINTNSPTNGINLLDRDISIKCSNNLTGANSLLFQNSNNNYTWRIRRVDAGNSNNTSNLIFSGGNQSSNKDSLNDNIMVLKSDGNVGIGIKPTTKLHINGSSIIETNLTVNGTFSAGVSYPTISSSNLVNCIVSSIVNTKLIINGIEAELSLIVIVSPILASINTELQITLPLLVTNLSNRYDIIAQCSGYTDDTNLIVLQNILCTGVVSTTNAIIKFQSVSTDTHVVQVTIKYII